MANSSSNSNPKSTSGADPRADLCRSLALGTPAQAYHIIADGAHRAPEQLLHRGLNAKTLAQLGYDSAGMKRLGYGEAALRTLGFKEAVKKPSDAPGATGQSAHTAPAAPHAAHVAGAPRPLSADDPMLKDGGIAPELKALLARGLRARELHEEGWPVARCKKAGCPTGDLLRLGFTFEELAPQCSAAELRREGYGVRELKRFFTGHDLKQAGFSASDMRLSGYTIRELLALGFNENHVRTAGFSTAELMREGLTRTTRDI